MDAAVEPRPGDGQAVAVVPLKALDRAKGRLGSELPAADRRALTAWMLARVVEACRAARAVGDVLVVAGDEAAARLARGLGVTTILEPHPTLAAALATADALLAGTRASLVVTADLPLVTPASLDELVGAAPGGPALVVAESVDGGTSALLRRPATVVGTRFGPGSARAHLDLAAQAGIPGVRVHLPALALDVDDAGALRTAAGRSPALAAWLVGRGLGLQAAAS